MAKKRKKVVIHNQHEVAGIRLAAQAVARVRDALKQRLCPGMSTLDIDKLAADLIAAEGADSAFLGYQGFPGTICISVNDEVVHGIGSANKIIKVGDLVSIDCGVQLNGFIGDTATTVSIGQPTGQVANLLRVTEESLMAGIAAACRNQEVWDIGAAVSAVVQRNGFHVVRDYVGHGCGVALHEPPEVPNYPTSKSRIRLIPGMILAIEPMVNMGTHQVKRDADGWTVRTADGSLSAHFEHMVLITENEPEILTWHKTA